ncbi:anthranilate synthase component I [Halobacteriales archaeon SW_7_71_33]|nr:MAG: anthranilate synthase component I [Halobacteriales archaeon SW_7_71_33]
MQRVERERVERDLAPAAVYRAVDGRALLERGARGWPATVVFAEPVDSFRYRRGADTESATGFERLRRWLTDAGVALAGSDEPWRSTPATGAVGFLGYDLAAELETLPDETVRDVALPDVAVDLYDTGVRVEEDALLVEGVAHERQRCPPSERVATLAARLRSADPVTDEPGRIGVDGLTVNVDRETYVAGVEHVKERIRAGDTFQANVSQRLTFETAARPVDLYAALRETNPAPYMGLFESGDPDDGERYAVVSTSPELLLRRSGRRLRTRPIAGTRPRGDDAEADDALRAELTASEKERAEHSMLVDLARNDLGAVSAYGSVEVERFLETVPYAAVRHLESVVTGDLREGADTLDAVRAVFPGGTVTGAPKPRTLAIIDEVEPVERGPYTGAMGRIGFDGDATLNMLIRTVVVDGERCHLQVGGGVVHDSHPRREYAETLHKAAAVLEAFETDGERLTADDVAAVGPDSEPGRGREHGQGHGHEREREGDSGAGSDGERESDSGAGGDGERERGRPPRGEGRD